MESQTLSSSPDDTGHSYWVSFTNASFAKGSTSLAHRGILNGFGPRSGDKAIVKAFRDEAGTEDRCDVEIAKAEKAQELACLFRRKFLENNQCITFEKPMKALMDHVALMNALSITNRRMSKHEWVLIERNVGKRFHIYVSRNGEVRQNTDSALTAFVHFSYHHSGGELVVCGIKGQADVNCWTLKTPTIHSVRSEYGLSDCGQSGIMQVLEKHECNYICEGLQLPDIIKPKLTRQFNFDFPESRPIPVFERQASAPYDPEVFVDPASPMVQGYLDSPPPYLLGPIQDHQYQVKHGLDCCSSPMEGDMCEQR